MDIADIAMICHEANRVYCATLGDYSQPPWSEAPGWQRDSAINGVRFRIDNPGTTPRAQHESWLRDKIADGWVYGPVKDAAAKQHPCCVEYDQLPIAQRRKDVLFGAIVDALTKES